jgi:hypothetical protein
MSSQRAVVGLSYISLSRALIPHAGTLFLGALAGGVTHYKIPLFMLRPMKNLFQSAPDLVLDEIEQGGQHDQVAEHIVA